MLQRKIQGLLFEAVWYRFPLNQKSRPWTGLFYVRDRGTVCFLTVAPFKINGLMKTLCLCWKPNSISVNVTSIIALRWQRNPKDRLNIDVTTQENQNRYTLCVCCMHVLASVRTRGTRGAGSQTGFDFLLLEENACQLKQNGFNINNATNQSGLIVAQVARGSAHKAELYMIPKPRELFVWNM